MRDVPQRIQDPGVLHVPLTLHQRQYWAWLLQRRAASDTVESLASTLVDEVGLGKTIEAGLVISQRWAERRRGIAWDLVVLNEADGAGDA